MSLTESVFALLASAMKMKMPLRSSTLTSPMSLSKISLACKLKLSKMMKKVQKKRRSTLEGVRTRKSIDRQKSAAPNLKTYIYKVLKEVHPDLGVSTATMNVMHACIVDIMNRVTDETARLMTYSKTKTMTGRDIQTAVRIVIPGELAKYAVNEGTKAVTKYNGK